MERATGSMLLTLLTVSMLCGGAFAHGGSHGHHSGGHAVHTAAHAAVHHYAGFPTHAYFSRPPAVSPARQNCKPTAGDEDARDCAGSTEQPADSAAGTTQYNGR